MTQIVLWSGGMDSTLLLRMKSLQYSTDSVNALTVLDIGATRGQIRAERKTRKDLLKKLPPNIKHYEVKVDSKFPHITWQMSLWLSHTIPYVGENDTVNMGYLSSDGYDFWNHKEKLANAFSAHMKLMGNKNAKLEFPLQVWTKGDVIKELKRVKLLRDCWYCGKPKNGKPCGKCMKCISYKRWFKYPEHGVYV